MKEDNNLHLEHLLFPISSKLICGFYCFEGLSLINVLIFGFEGEKDFCVFCGDHLLLNISF